MLESLVATLTAFLAGAIAGQITYAFSGDTTTSLWSAGAVVAAVVASWVWFYIRASNPRPAQASSQTGESNAR